MSHIKQLGSYQECAKRNCSKKPQWRVILGSFDIQAYSCSDHLPWTCRLDMLPETFGTERGWSVGYRVPNAGNTVEIRETRVTPMLDNITRTDFGRIPDIGNVFPDENGHWH